MLFRSLGLATLLVQTVLCADIGSVHWDYSDGHNGPKNWGKLQPDYAACDGNRQSPINLETSANLVSNRLLTTWSDVQEKLTLQHNGHGVEVKSELFSKISTTLRCKQFQLQNFHLHHPSEHTIDNKQYDLELHLVFSNLETKQNKVIGVLFEKSNATGTQVFANLPMHKVCPKDEHKSNKGKCTKCKDKFDFTNFSFAPLAQLLSETKVWNYEGSLTVPPCSENVHWTVVNKVVPINPNTLDNIIQSMGEASARPIQKISSEHRLGVESSSTC